MDTSEWVKKYEKKTGENFYEVWDTDSFPYIRVMPDGSFFTYGFRKNALCLGPTSGVFKVLYKEVERIAMENGCKFVLTTTERNPKAYCRLTGGIVTSVTCFINGDPPLFEVWWEVNYGK